MPKDVVEKIIGRALLEDEFRKLLLTDPDKALNEYDLTAQQRKEVLAQVKVVPQAGGGEIERGKFI